MLIETLIALKMAELDDLAAQLTRSPESVRALGASLLLARRTA